jgi:hypothetical protein
MARNAFRNFRGAGLTSSQEVRSNLLSPTLRVAELGPHNVLVI